MLRFLLLVELLRSEFRSWWSLTRNYKIYPYQYQIKFYASDLFATRLTYEILDNVAFLHGLKFLYKHTYHSCYFPSSSLFYTFHYIMAKLIIANYLKNFKVYRTINYGHDSK